MSNAKQGKFLNKLPVNDILLLDPSRVLLHTRLKKIK